MALFVAAVAALLMASSLPAVSAAVSSGSWEDHVVPVLRECYTNGTFPGCVAGALNLNNQDWTYLTPFGHFTYGQPAPVNGDNPLVDQNTIFDMASLTKVFTATTMAMFLYQRGELDVHSPVAMYLGPGYNVNGKSDVTVMNLLLHNAGFPPDPVPNYWDPRFGCPETSRLPKPLENYSCQVRIYKAMLAQPLVYPTGSQYIYSDISFITLMYVLGSIARTEQYITASQLRPGCDQGVVGAADMCYFEALVRVYLFDYLGLKNSQFLPPQELWSHIPPTWNSSYLHGIMQGVVSDGNSYALGGISGHAGLFSTVGDAMTLIHRLLTTEADDPWINSTTVTRFTTVYNITQSSRAWGWDTNAANGEHLCAGMSPQTFMHTGYTGTMICADPVTRIALFLFTNRVYPNDNNEPKIMQCRPQFTQAAMNFFANKQTEPRPAKSSGDAGVSVRSRQQQH